VVKADTFLSVQYTWKRNRNSDFLRVPHTNNEAGHPSDYGLQDWDFIPGRGRDFTSRYHVQTVCGARTAAYPINIGGPSPGCKVGRA
jgi:hypothetical protein